MTLVTLPNKIMRNNHHTVLVMRDGGTCQAVCVVNDGRIGDVCSKLGLIESIASSKLDHGEVAFDGRVWITHSDMPRPLHAGRH
ncbi:hypothetical protein [Neorhizobium galegae]|uniref:hypothetical protein n=1 Tax=Neorhizobium galegae TaxID=399 RepID=UPI00062242FE|nr:hypothetical protein [Neorhizobium galegae]CDZ48657.1 Hypothetical protein NGAL_HAMBI2427_27500 [Neorhizobium galegae bv. orientalis]